MKIITEELTKIKETQSVRMYANENILVLYILKSNGEQVISIPISKVFQVKRGLESYVQKYWRKKTKKANGK
ncbi:MAG TPA: hypothetical protein VFF49_11230 [Thermodesulfobacteriota bacterium]|nr:hypothetical protein [Thermodesulfobacteriota bacterium]